MHTEKNIKNKIKIINLIKKNIKIVNDKLLYTLKLYFIIL